MVDASANGALLSKSYNEAYEILERIAVVQILMYSQAHESIVV